MIGQFKLSTHDCNSAYFMKAQAWKKRRVLYCTPDYGIGNQPHTAKSKVVRNVCLFTSFSIDSNLQDELDGQDGVRNWMTGLTIDSYILNLFISKMFMRYSKTNTTWFISTSSKNSWSLGVGCVRLLHSALRREVVPLIQHLGTSHFYYFPQYHVVFVYYIVTVVATVLSLCLVGDWWNRSFAE